MRVLFTCVPAEGHFHPLGPLALALASGSHEVAFATSVEFCPYIEKAGFLAFPAGLDPAEQLRRAYADPGGAGECCEHVSVTV